MAGGQEGEPREISRQDRLFRGDRRILDEVEEPRPAFEPEDLCEAGVHEIAVYEQYRDVLLEAHAEGEVQRHECLPLPRNGTRDHDDVAARELSHAAAQRVIDQRTLDA